MPPMRLWFIGLRALIVAMGGALLAQFAQLSGTATSISSAAWIVSGITGLVAAANAMHDAWPAAPAGERGA